MYFAVTYSSEKKSRILCSNRTLFLWQLKITNDQIRHFLSISRGLFSLIKSFVSSHHKPYPFFCSWKTFPNRIIVEKFRQIFNFENILNIQNVQKWRDGKCDDIHKRVPLKRDSNYLESVKKSVTLLSILENSRKLNKSILFLIQLTKTDVSAAKFYLQLALQWYCNNCTVQLAIITFNI